MEMMGEHNGTLGVNYGIDYGAPWGSGNPWWNQPVYYGVLPYDPEPIQPPDDRPWLPVPVPMPTPGPSIEDMRKMIEQFFAAKSEFAVMAAIEALSDDAKRRVLAWLKVRLDMTPGETK